MVVAGVTAFLLPNVVGLRLGPVGRTQFLPRFGHVHFSSVAVSPVRCRPVTAHAAGLEGHPPVGAVEASSLAAASSSVTLDHALVTPDAEDALNGHPTDPLSRNVTDSEHSGRSHKPSKPPSAERKMQYVPLHVHSDFSLLDGASHLSDLVARAAELGVPALALTDHGVLYGAIALVKICNHTAVGRHQQTPVKPIIGNEMYLVNYDIPYVPPADDDESDANSASASSSQASVDSSAEVETARGKATRKRPKPPRRYHLTVLAKNSIGYRNLVQLTSKAHLQGRVGPGNPRPCINKAMLYEHREGLIILSGCLGGEVAQSILNNRDDVAADVARWFRDVFRDDYYLEIQDHNRMEDRIVNRAVVQIGKDLSIPVVATNDSHFTTALDAEAHDALICIQTGKMLDEENRLRYAGNEYFKSVDEMRQCFLDHLSQEDVDLALANTLHVAEKVETYELFGDTRIPDFPIPPCPAGDNAHSAPLYDEKSHASYLRYVSLEGLEDRLRTRLQSGLLRFDNDETKRVYFSRLEFELNMIDSMGFSSYFLVVWDYIRFARKEGIPVGPGRGSAAGSIVAFALRITDVDPIEYNLLFERFLNPERRSMPDIDTDFSVEGRERVIQYVTEKYGQDKVAQIITFNRLTSKSVLKDVARVHRVPYADADKMAKLIPVVRGKPATLSKMLSDQTPSKEFVQFLKKRPDYMSWIDKARRIEGTNKTFGIHAAGVVISSKPLTDFVPLSRAKHGETITQYPMEDVEALGLLKMDFLGLKNLTVIENAVRFINSTRVRTSRTGCTKTEEFQFTVDSLALDDANTYEFLATGELDGIFQLDASVGMRRIVRELRPSSLEDISSILALYRPGPLDAGLIPKFIRRKHGIEPIVYEHPLLEPILRETYGIMVYQEQIMRIARDLAGYSLGQADILRRAMGKKKVADMEREKPRFVAGAQEKGVSEETAASLFDTMTLFAEYCFNKSHSTAYAFLTYQTAFLKANYPVEYTAALLRANSNQSEKLVRYLADANASGVLVLPPSINRSELSFSVDKVVRNGEDVSAVLFGLEAIKTVGAVAGESIIEERNTNGPFLSIMDLIERIGSRVLNKRSLGALVLCGAFDELHSNRKVLHEQVELLLDLNRKARERRNRRLRKSKITASPYEPDAVDRTAGSKDASVWEEVQLRLRHDNDTSNDFPLLEKLSAEKATLGFYASGHPLGNTFEVSKMLTATPIDKIVGELSSEDNDPISYDGGVVEHVDISCDGGVPHGAEVVCVSLITDLKHLVTSKGQKMAKWTMEDTVGRVPAVVFPNAYALCEAVVESNSSESDNQRGNSHDPELVVTNEARVVVWGKVDRESSSIVQVIVEDVQRLYDVQVLVAGSKYDHEKERAECRAVMELVRYNVRQVQDPNSTYTSNPQGTYTYRNKSGDEVIRRRRKKLDLQTMPRIPVAVMFKTESGPVVYESAGSQCRMSELTGTKISELNRRTNCSFRLVKVSEILAEGRMPNINTFVSTSCLSANMQSGLNCTAEPSQVTLESVVGEPGAYGDSNVDNFNTELALGEGVGDIDSREHLAEDLDSKTALNREPMKFAEFVDYSRDLDDKMASGRDDWLLADELKSSSNSRFLQKYREEAFVSVAQCNPSTTRYVETLKLRLSTQREFSQDADLATSSRNAALEVADHYIYSDAVPSANDDYSPRRRRGSVVSLPVHSGDTSARSNGLAQERELMRAKLIESFNREQLSMYNDLITIEKSLGMPLNEILSSSSNRNGIYRELDTRSDPDSASSMPSEALHKIDMPRIGQSDVQALPQLKAVTSSSAVDTSNSDTMERNLITEQGMRLDAIRPEGYGHNSTSASPESLSVTSVLPELNKSRSKSGVKSLRAREIKLNFAQVGFKGLLDAICFVAGEAAWMHVQSEYKIQSMDKFSFSDAIEELTVSGSVVLVEDCLIHVLVRVRGASVSKGARRTRSYGFAVVTLISSTPLPEFSPETARARSDFAAVQKRLQGAESGRNASVRSSTRKSKYSDMSLDTRNYVLPTEGREDARGLFDGGIILLWLASAAEEAVLSMDADVVDVVVQSVSQFHVDSSTELARLGHKVLDASARITRRYAASVSLHVSLRIADKDSGEHNDDDESVTPVEMSGFCAHAVFQVGYQRR